MNCSVTTTRPRRTCLNRGCKAQPLPGGVQGHKQRKFRLDNNSSLTSNALMKRLWLVGLLIATGIAVVFVPAVLYWHFQRP
jgi:hypothetical protein